MRKAISLVFAVWMFLFYPLSLNAGEINSTELNALTNWQPDASDTLWIDVEKNLGYLMHADGSRISFPVATGQKRVVYYLGMRYFAATPKKKWMIKSDTIQPDRYTFGSTGQFLRLFSFNDVTGQYTETRYGIHSHKDIDYMINLAANDRFRSYGCVLVSKEVLDILYEIYFKTGQNLRVETYG